MQRHDESRRARLLATASRAFAERGFEEVSVREIASKADVNVALINYYFGSKAGLYRAVALDAFQRVMRELPPPVIRAEDSPESSLQRFVRWFVGLILAKGKDEDLRRITFRELQNPSPVLSDIVAETAFPVRDLLESIVNRLLPPDADIVTRRKALGLTLAVCMQYETSGALLERLGLAAPQSADEIEIHTRAVTQFALGGIQQLSVRSGAAS
jgi:AcrR family transcriptional regulator